MFWYPAKSPWQQESNFNVQWQLKYRTSEVKLFILTRNHNHTYKRNYRLDPLIIMPSSSVEPKIPSSSQQRMRKLVPILDVRIPHFQRKLCLYYNTVILENTPYIKRLVVRLFSRASFRNWSGIWPYDLWIASPTLSQLSYSGVTQWCAPHDVVWVIWWCYGQIIPCGVQVWPSTS